MYAAAPDPVFLCRCRGSPSLPEETRSKLWRKVMTKVLKYCSIFSHSLVIQWRFVNRVQKQMNAFLEVSRAHQHACLHLIHSWREGGFPPQGSAMGQSPTDRQARGGARAERPGLRSPHCGPVSRTGGVCGHPFTPFAYSSLCFSYPSTGVFNVLWLWRVYFRTHWLTTLRLTWALWPACSQWPMFF